jgi:hypothetical protein
MIKLCLATSAVILAMSTMDTQDPLTLLPDSYSKQFENEWVRIVRVHYGPHAKLPAHAHNALPAAYVYLNDAGPVLFKHIGTSYGAATRPPTRAGGFRVFRGLDEIHEVENTSALPSDFLRVEFKTDPKDVRTLKGRFFRERAAHGENLQQVQFENDQVRITRVIGAPGRSIRLSTAASEPSLLIALRAAQLRETGSHVTLAVGQERWLPARSALTLENAGADPSEFLRFDFKTAPIASSASVH